MRFVSAFFLSFIFLSLFLSCQNKLRKQADEIILQSIQAHGGSERWDEITAFSFQKESTLLREDSTIESHLVQNLSFRLKPYFEAKIIWEKDGIDQVLAFDGRLTTFRMAGNEVLNPGFLKQKKTEIDAAFYVMNKPFDLARTDLHKEYEGIITLPDNREVWSVKVIDGNPADEGIDIWWYYFDQDSFLLIAYKVKTSDHFSMVYNLEWFEVDGVKFPKSRESFRADEDGNILYKRASYAFVNYKLE